MSTQILMPALSPTMEEGKLSKWLVKEGDEVHSGDILAEIETDKATMEFEAVDEGRIGKILVPEGTEGVKVNAPIAELVSDGEDATPVAAATAKEPRTETKQDAKAELAKANGHAAPAPAAVAVAQAAVTEPEVPEGTEMVTMTVREALRDAMAEEMRRDETVFLMGEEVAQYQDRKSVV
jgi:pyruvate dehydrogenase E1 component beta subunit